MRKVAIALAALALGHAAPALAQDGHFVVDGKTVTVPAPKGYCAAGKAVDTYFANQRRVNPQMVPDVVMTQCGVDVLAFDLFAVRVVRDAPPTTLQAFLAELRRTMPAAQAAPSLLTPGQTEDLNKRLSEALSANTTVTNTLKPVGVDEMCGYLAGIMHFDVGGGASGSVTLVGCATVIGGRPVYLMRYRPSAANDKPAEALPEIKAFAQSIMAGQ